MGTRGGGGGGVVSFRFIDDVGLNLIMDDFIDESLTFKSFVFIIDES